MKASLLLSDGSVGEGTSQAIAEALSSEGAFWLDLQDIEPGGGVLKDIFGFHPLAIEDAEHFGQRPKMEDYDGYLSIVVFGSRQSTGEMVEVHGFLSDSYLVTVRRGPCEALDEVRSRAAIWRHHADADTSLLFYRVADALVDGFFPLLERIDDEIDEIEDDILKAPTESQLARLFELKRSLVALRKVVTPERDLFSGVVGGAVALPNMTVETERLFRDLYDHLIRVSDLVDSYRDLLSSAVDMHLSTVSNRLNVVMKQLTIIATIFLPLTFLTGFFGQNFAWLIGHITAGATFVWLGIGSELVAIGILVYFFRRRRWI
ncbi:MAG: magnesium transporter CorA family protein [Acidimicrobiales bacterium]